MQTFNIKVCNQLKTIDSSDTCSADISDGSLVVEFDALLCLPLSDLRYTQVVIETLAGGDVRADIILKVGYIFDVTSGYAIYSPSNGEIVLAWKTNQTLGAPAVVDLYAAAFCVQLTNPMLPATGAELMVSAVVGKNSARLPPVSIPGIQVLFVVNLFLLGNCCCKLVLFF